MTYYLNRLYSFNVILSVAEVEGIKKRLEGTKMTLIRMYS